MKNILIFILVLVFSFSLKAQNNTIKSNIFKTSGRVIKNSILTIPSDFVFMGKEVSNDWKKTGYYLGGIVGLIAVDKVTTKFYQNHVEPSIDYKLPNINLIYNNTALKWVVRENAYLTYPIIANYIFSFATNKERGQYASINALKAIKYSTIISQLGLKTIFGRNRPFRPLNSQSVDGVTNINPNEWTNNNWDFFNPRKEYLFSSAEASAFPSLHTTAYFAIAKVIQMEYDNYWIPYSVMSIAWLSNIKKHNHWVSDMVVGGIVGTLIGRSIVKSSWKKRGIDGALQKKNNISFNIVPQYSNDFTGLHIVGTF